MTITLITLKKVLYALFLFLFVFCDKSYSGDWDLIKNPFCLPMNGVVVKVRKGDSKTGYIKLGGHNVYDSLIAGFTIDPNIIDENLYVGLKIPHKQNFCLADYGGNEVVKKKDGTKCWMAFYFLTGELLPEKYANYLEKTLMSVRNDNVRDVYQPCGGDISKLKLR